MTTPTPPSGPDDARDSRVATWLAVDPLDDVTRARLVRTALAETTATPDDAPIDAPIHAATAAHPSRRRLVAVVSVAAVLVGLLVVALAVLGPRDDDSTTTALDGPAPTAEPDASRETGDATALAPSRGAPQPAEVLAVPPLPSIGDLGDVSSETALEEKARAALSVPLAAPTTTIEGCAAAAGRALGTLTAVGTGQIDGRPATVVVARQEAGPTAVVAAVGRSCGRAVSVILP